VDQRASVCITVIQPDAPKFCCVYRHTQEEGHSSIFRKATRRITWICSDPAFGGEPMTSIRMLAISISCSTLLCAGAWPSTPASAQVVERGVEGAAVGAVIGGIVGGGRGAATGAAIGGGVGVLSGAAEANSRAQDYYGPPPPDSYGPPPPDYYGPQVSISIAPPLLPVYEQPLCPGPGYVWAPGYWAYASDGYYWVPGTWVFPPAEGLLWTPGYWGYEGSRYLWHAGYWGPHVGYYGGIDYGFGYSGSGYEGGYWNNGVFFYNTAVTRVNTTVITNTYNKTVNTATMNHVSFNGPGGAKAQPTAQELAWSHEQHTRPTALQVQHQKGASTNRALFASVNHGAPAVTATAKPGAFEAAGPKGPHTDHKAPGGGGQANIQSSPAIPGGPGGPGEHKGPVGPRGPGSPDQWPGESHANLQGGPGIPSGSGGRGEHKGPVGPAGPGGPGQPGWPGGSHANIQGTPGVPGGPGGPGGGKGKSKPAVCSQNPHLPVCEQKH
jgi:YXWGXW repeat-containing protein